MHITALADAPLSGPTTALKSRSIAFEEGCRQLTALLGEVPKADAFFDPGELATMVEWANYKAFDGLTFTAGPSALLIADSGEIETRAITRPEALRRISDAALARLTPQP